MSIIPEGAPAMVADRWEEDALERVGAGEYYDPHRILGPHAIAAEQVADRVTVIRALRPLATMVSAVLSTGSRIQLGHIGSGVWEGVTVFGHVDYAIEARYEDGSVWVADDPYRFSPTLGEVDLHLIGEGRHERLWEALGAHSRTWRGADGDVGGTSFAVWAPHARAVRVIGDFNDWDGRMHAMRTMGSSGVWELFVPGAHPGSNYKYEILAQDGTWVRKADPMARCTQVPPDTASVIDAGSYMWNDTAWMRRRASVDPHRAPVSIYELHLGSWRDGLDYRSAADKLVEYVTDLQYTHVEFMPLAEHPFSGSWGYQVTGYYAPTRRFGDPDDLRFLIDRLHQAGIGVILDWVPGHFPKDEWALARFDGEALYEHPDPRRGEHRDWGTLIFDFGRPQVRNFLVANALYWLEEFHVDGLRVDAVASMLYLDYSRAEGEWEPNIHGGRENLEAIQFIQEVTATAYKHHPGILMIAEESTSWPGVTTPTDRGGLGFGLKWNMGWMHDSLSYIGHDPIHRAYHHHDITFSFAYMHSENFLLPISHDEVVHGKGSLLSKMPGDHVQQCANLRAYLAFMWAHPGKKLLFMGQEFGQLGEWNHDHGLDWWLTEQPAHQSLTRFVARLNTVYREHSALWKHDDDPAGFQWLNGGDASNNVVSFLRQDDHHMIAALTNFAGIPHSSYRVGVPEAGEWELILNSDDEEFGGSGLGGPAALRTDDIPWNGRDASVELTLPPLGSVWLRKANAPTSHA